MTRQPLKINIMTAGFAPGDAISNYILSKARLLSELGGRIGIYADFIHPDLAEIAQHSSLYQPTGDALLWFHYSIYSDNVEQAIASHDYKVMDYHGICPPHLFEGQNEHLRHLCQVGMDVLPDLIPHFEHFVVHSEYTRRQLTDLGCTDERLHKIALAVDLSHLLKCKDPELSALLGKLKYFLFVGRVVPQKDILSSLAIFAEVRKQQPDVVYIVVGTREQTGPYQRQIDRFITEHNLESCVMFVGQVNNPAVLAALFQNATFYLATSEWESFCVPLAESLFFGVPTIVHDVPPLPEVAGPAAVVIDKQHPQEAAQQIAMVLENDAHYGELSRAAVAWAQQYTDQMLAQNLERFLRHIAATGSGEPDVTEKEET